VQSDWNDPRTTARWHLADALVAGVGHEHVAARIDGHAAGIEEAGVGRKPVSKYSIEAADPARERCDHCPLNNNTSKWPPHAHAQNNHQFKSHKFDSVQHVNTDKNNESTCGTKYMDGGMRRGELLLCKRLSHANAPIWLCASRGCRVKKPINVPPPAVTLRIRLFLLSATNTLPLASTATLPG
jgi:hypothetical protein